MIKLKYLFIAVLLIISLTACKGKTQDTVTDNTDIADENENQDSTDADDSLNGDNMEEQTEGENADEDSNTASGTGGENQVESESGESAGAANEVGEDKTDTQSSDNDKDGITKEEENKSDTSSQPNNSSTDKNAGTNKNDEKKDSFKLVLKDGSTLEYKKYVLDKDYQDEYMLCIYFEYTNQSKESKSAGDTFALNCFQKGQECDLLVVVDGPDEFKNMMKSIKKGEKISVCTYFYLEELGSVEIEIAPYDEKDNTKKVTKTLDLSV